VVALVETVEVEAVTMARFCFWILAEYRVGAETTMGQLCCVEEFWGFTGSMNRGGVFEYVGDA